MTPNRPRDPNQLARSTIDSGTGGEALTATLRQKNRARTRLRSRWARRAGKLYDAGAAG
jgi:hypothetical protein